MWRQCVTFSIHRFAVDNGCEAHKTNNSQQNEERKALQNIQPPLPLRTYENNGKCRIFHAIPFYFSPAHFFPFFTLSVSSYFNSLFIPQYSAVHWLMLFNAYIFLRFDILLIRRSCALFVCRFVFDGNMYMKRAKRHWHSAISTVRKVHNNI